MLYIKLEPIKFTSFVIGKTMFLLQNKRQSMCAVEQHEASWLPTGVQLHLELHRNQQLLAKTN